MEIWLPLILAGLLAGFFAGLLGIGGGFIIVPVLLLLLPKIGIPDVVTPHFAIATSLLCICITALVSTRSHHLKSAVDWQVVKQLTLGLVIGAGLGALLASSINGKSLIIIFVCGALITATYLLSGHKPSSHSNPTKWHFWAYGNFAGGISSLIGIGGGSLIVPFLIYKGKAAAHAVGTAAACGFPIAFSGVLVYAYSGSQESISIDYATGYLYWPAFLSIVILSSLTAPLGAKLAHFLPEKRLRQVFALFLFFTSAQIIYSHWS